MVVSSPMIMRIIRDNLLAIAAAYHKATGKSLTQVSHEFYGNGDFFAKLRRGEQSISVKKLEEMVAAFRADWPKEARWPATRPVMMGRRPQE